MNKHVNESLKQVLTEMLKCFISYERMFETKLKQCVFHLSLILHVSAL